VAGHDGLGVQGLDGAQGCEPVEPALVPELHRDELVTFEVNEMTGKRVGQGDAAAILPDSRRFQ